MAKKYSIQDAYNEQMGAEDEAAEMGAAEEVATEAQPLALQGEELAQAQELKAAGDQTGDYSELGKFIAGLMGGSGATQPPMA